MLTLLNHNFTLEMIALEGHLQTWPSHVIGNMVALVSWCAIGDHYQVSSHGDPNVLSTDRTPPSGRSMIGLDSTHPTFCPMLSACSLRPWPSPRLGSLLVVFLWRMPTAS